jgi:hypothetical protein
MAGKRTDPVVIRVNIEVNPQVSEIEVDRALWDSLTPQQRSEYAAEVATDELNNAGGYGWHIEDPDDMASTEAAS